MMMSNELRDKMSAIADLALSCDAKVGTLTVRPNTTEAEDEADKCKTIHDYAAKIALAALELCPPERLADVAAIFKEKIVAKAVKPEYNPFMIGPFRIEHVSSKTVTISKVKIGERIFSCETVDIAGACNVTIFDNGNSAVSMKINRGKVTSSMVGLKAMKEYIRQLSGNRHSGRRGFLPREIAKLEDK